MNNISFKHCGNKTVVQVPKTENGINTFKLKLQGSGFTILPSKAVRKLLFFSNDWPIEIYWETKDTSCVISIAMFIPWSWICITIFSLMIIPPLLIDYFFHITGLPFYAISSFAILFTVLVFFVTFIRNRVNPRQRFDLSQHANWQKLPRIKWNNNLKTLLEDSFQIKVMQN